MKSNLREIIHYIDESTLEKAKNEKVQKQESLSKVSKDVEESVDKMISNRMSKAYSEWKSNQDTRPACWRSCRTGARLPASGAAW